MAKVTGACTKRPCRNGDHYGQCGDVTAPYFRPVDTAIPDLDGIPLDDLTATGGTPLGHAIALYRERLKETGTPLSSFNARI